MGLGLKQGCLCVAAAALLLGACNDDGSRPKKQQTVAAARLRALRAPAQSVDEPGTGGSGGGGCEHDAKSTHPCSDVWMLEQGTGGSGGVPASQPAQPCEYDPSSPHPCAPIPARVGN